MSVTDETLLRDTDIWHWTTKSPLSCVSNWIISFNKYNTVLKCLLWHTSDCFLHRVNTNCLRSRTRSIGLKRYPRQQLMARSRLLWSLKKLVAMSYCENWKLQTRHRFVFILPHSCLPTYIDGCMSACLPAFIPSYQHLRCLPISVQTDRHLPTYLRCLPICVQTERQLPA